MAKDLNPADNIASDGDEPVQNEAEYPISTLVWGKLKGFDWWPGRISSHIEIGGSEPLPDDTLWVKWFGENQVSEVCRVKIVNGLAYETTRSYACIEGYMNLG